MMMTKTTIGLGVLLILVGVGAYFGSGTKSITALIPAFFGLPISLLGIAALQEVAEAHHARRSCPGAPRIFRLGEWPTETI